MSDEAQWLTLCIAAQAWARTEKSRTWAAIGYVTSIAAFACALLITIRKGGL